MSESGQTSFIPKRPITGSLSDRPGMSHSFGLINIVAFFILAASLVFYGGAWFYHQALYDEINNKCQSASDAGAQVQRCGLKATVALEQRNLPQDTILDLQRLDRKFRIAGDLLAKHIDMLPIFEMLEQLTLPSVYYDSFNYSAKGISMGGKASSYEDVAIQTQIFSADRGRIQSFIFSDLNSDAGSLVTFKLTMILEPSLTSYAASSTNSNALSS